MPQKSPGTSYTGKPVRRLKLPNIGPAKTISFFEEYLYALLAIVFLTVTILGKAGGFSSYNAAVIGAWVTAMLWCAHQLKDYFVEKAKAENGKTPLPQAEERATAPKGAVPLPAGMKPMIGPQWPVKSGAKPSWPKLPKELPGVTAQPQTIQANTEAGAQTPQTNSREKKRAFVYERPTLPDRKPKLPNNWFDPHGKNGKKPKKPKR